LWFAGGMASDAASRRPRLAAALNAGIGVTLALGLLFNLAEAVVGDHDTWPVEQPWSGVRIAVGLLFLGLVLARVVLWIVCRVSARRGRLRA
jgi:hypothetical protein